MATTRTLILTTVMGNKRVHIFHVTDTSYPTGVGISMTAAQCGMASIDCLIPIPVGGIFFATWGATGAVVRLWTATTVEYNAAAGDFWAVVIGS